MQKAGLTRGRLAVGLIVGLCGGLSQAEPDLRPCCGLAPAQVAHGLAGEWSGQVLVRSAGGDLSTSPASMSAKLDAESKMLELYYEGFAFGQPVEGAMRFSFAPNEIEADIRDGAINLRATCQPDSPEDAAAQADNSYAVGCESDSAGDFRIHFTRIDAEAWNIAYESRDDLGQWASMLTLQLDRLGAGEASAAAPGFKVSPMLLELRDDAAVASVETDD